MKFELLPGWKAPIEEVKPAPLKMRKPLPKKAAKYAGSINVVADEQGAAELIQLAQERAIAYIGIDTEFRYERPPLVFDKVRKAYDPRSVKPLLLSLALVEPESMYRFVVDVRRKAVLDSLQRLLKLPITFVGHFLRAEFTCLWQLGLKEPRNIWDTWVAEKCFYLGLHKSEHVEDGDVQSEIQAKEDNEADDLIRYGLVATCDRYGIPHQMAADKEWLQRSFLDHPDEADFTKGQIAYAAADAEAAAKLYEPQQAKATREGVLSHLIVVEMPWVAVNARISWNGVRIEPQMRSAVWNRCDSKLVELKGKLLEMGLANINSYTQVKEFFGKEGLLEAFKMRESYSFNKEKLKDFKDHYPSVKLLYEARRVQSLKNDNILLPGLVGTDGRVHAEHCQLGAISGRQTCKLPNLHGIGRILRPLVIPDPGFGIGEVDLSQIEVGIAAAVYGDKKLIEMFNAGDVYSKMAQSFYHAELSEPDQNLGWADFKKLHPELRSVMKTCTLGIIYGFGPFGLALRLKVDKAKAGQLQERFMQMFPELAQAVKDTSHYGGLRGFAVTSTGLRRYSGATGAPSNWQDNWMRNHPIQGTAADLFKIAGIRLDRLYRRYNAKIIIPFHDAYVFEAPLDKIKEVSELTDRVMCEVVAEYFPELRPRAEQNIDHPNCWNKDGHADDLNHWLATTEKN